MDNKSNRPDSLRNLLVIVTKVRTELETFDSSEPALKLYNEILAVLGTKYEFGEKKNILISFTNIFLFEICKEKILNLLRGLTPLSECRVCLFVCPSVYLCDNSQTVQLFSNLSSDYQTRVQK